MFVDFDELYVHIELWFSLFFTIILFSCYWHGNNASKEGLIHEIMADYSFGGQSPNKIFMFCHIFFYFPSFSSYSYPMLLCFMEILLLLCFAREEKMFCCVYIIVGKGYGGQVQSTHI